MEAVSACHEVILQAVLFIQRREDLCHQLGASKKSGGAGSEERVWVLCLLFHVSDAILDGRSAHCRELGGICHSYQI